MTGDLSAAAWRISSYSGANGDCVEVATNLPGTIAVRDSKDRGGPVLVFTASAWESFLTGMKAS